MVPCAVVRNGLRPGGGTGRGRGASIVEGGGIGFGVGGGARKLTGTARVISPGLLSESGYTKSSVFLGPRNSRGVKADSSNTD